MSNQSNNLEQVKVHWSFWVIGLLALIWNIMGAVNYFVQMDPEMLATYPESHRALVEGRPAWATGAFALAVFGGLLGCIMLLCKKSFAYYLFIASQCGVIIVMIYSLNMASSINFSALDMFLTIFMPLVVPIFLIWYSKRSESKGWIA